MRIVKYIPAILLILLLQSSIGFGQNRFAICGTKGEATILYSKEGPPIDSIVANLLADDILEVTGRKLKVSTDYLVAKGNVIVIGKAGSELIQKFTKKNILPGNFKNKWECYAIKIVDKPNAGISKALVIAGSDARGTAYGVFHVSEKLGVSPWHWWADVKVDRKTALYWAEENFISAEPSVKFRGIFINDEDWGLQPWAAKNYEPETGDIGPKSYAKIFELLLRLKANLIWPAMHPSTKAFFYYPGNKKVAADYGIVIGSSHAEPMLRNNVSEWDSKTMGAFNFMTNKESVLQYWNDRVKEVVQQDVVFSLGMRGVHDSGMEGVKNSKEAVPVIEHIFEAQRKMLRSHLQKEETTIPQAFTAYKEVLDIYDNGLKLPDDVMLVWPDDNYGYIHRLNSPKENKRSGGSGVYYHASYWGRPHDYLWLNTTHPSLIREEMMKAYATGSDRLWVLNVGDIKPHEYSIQLFLDMAYNAKPFEKSSFTKQHLLNWHSKAFGKDAAKITSVMWNYFNLAFERKPEFMGWSQTEPSTPTKHTTYNHFYYGDEAQRRLNKYEQLETDVRNLRNALAPDMKDAFYQLVYYPVVGSSLINKKFLYRDKSFHYAKQNRQSAFDYALWSKKAYHDILKETAYFNDQIANGKWKYIMSMKPRNLAVYLEPDLAPININSPGDWNVAPEGFSNDSLQAGAALSLPPFDSLNKQKYFVDVFLSGKTTLDWRADPSHDWIRLSAKEGKLVDEEGKKETRIWVDIDWLKFKTDSRKPSITFSAGKKKVIVELTLLGQAIKNFRSNDFIEKNGYVSMFASSYSRRNGKQSTWNEITDLGYTSKVMEASINKVDTATGLRPVNEEIIKRTNASLEYDFYNFTEAPAVVHVFSIPTHPVNNYYSMRYGVCIDNGPLKIADFKTVGRSEEWKQNVLSNQAARKIELPALTPGKHTLKIFAIDPGVMLDRMLIDFGGLKQAYSVIPETRYQGRVR